MAEQVAHCRIRLFQIKGLAALGHAARVLAQLRAAPHSALRTFAMRYAEPANWPSPDGLTPLTGEVASSARSHRRRAYFHGTDSTRPDQLPSCRRDQ
jgi:hypothetical protein